MNDIWAEFARAVVTLELQSGSIVLRPDEVGQVGLFPFQSAVHIITACNPGAKVDPTIDSDQLETDNRSRHEQLRIELVGHQCIPSIGSAIDGSFAEPGFAVVDIELDDAIGLARQFGQKAIYRWTSDQLRIVGVDESIEIELGWAIGKLGIQIPKLAD